MKYLKKFKLFESVSTKVRNYLDMIINITSGKQLDYYKWQLKNAKSVELRETPKSIKISKVVRKGCYENAYNVVMNNPKLDIKYVEGYISFFDITIEHAWNKIDDIYFDITLKHTNNDEYVSIKEYSFNEIVKYANITEHTGPYLLDAFKIL